MRRVIVDYKKLTQSILDLLVEKHPDGYNDSDIISFRNAQNELVEAVEVRTDDTIYLVKVSVKLAERMENEMIDDTINEEEIEPADIEDPEKELDEDSDI